MTAAQRQTNRYAQSSDFPDFGIFWDLTLLGLPDTKHGSTTVLRNIL